MLSEKFRKALEEYHRKKWFPEKYPEPFGEFIDYISEGMISDLVESWKQKKQGSLLDAGNYLLQILPWIQFREIYRDYRKALSEKLSGEVHPEFVFYFLRILPEEESSALWIDFQNWTDRWETVLSEWCRALLGFESSHAEFFTAFQNRLQLQASEELRNFEKHLRETRELFGWQIQTQSQAKTYLDLLRYFRFQRWKRIADWNDSVALAKAIAESIGVRKLPRLQSSENTAVQFLYPILPPARTTLEFGRTSGLVDALRFLQEFGKGIFYAGMNPELEIEQRICGDPALPWFWGSLISSILTDRYGVKNFIGISAEGMERDAGFVVDFWNRYEMALAIYRSQTDAKNVQDLYATWWDNAFTLEPPRFQYLFDLTRSSDSLYKASAMLRAKEVIQTLQTKYGNQWFASPKWSRRMREYFWEGYKLTMQDVVRDISS